MIKIYPVLFVLFLLVLPSCGGESGEMETGIDQRDQSTGQDLSQLYQTEPQQELVASGLSFRNELNEVLEYYFSLKDSLYSSNISSSSEIVTSMLNKIGDVDTGGLGEKADSLWTVHSDIITENGTRLIEATEINEQRGFFKEISRSMVELIGSFKPATYEVFIQSCQRSDAESNIWLSRSILIRNPYQGDTPNPCGEIQRKI